MSLVGALHETLVPSAKTKRVDWWTLYRADFARYRQHRPRPSAAVLFLTEQGLWALLQYRMASGLYQSALPYLLKKLALVAACIFQKLIEITTGISLPYRATIGPGLYIGHFGNVILHEDVVLGHTCNLSQGVTIGMSGRGDSRGVPRIGNRVYIATNGVVVGRITIGDEAAVAANSLVTRDVAARTTVMGVPARQVSAPGSDSYI